MKLMGGIKGFATREVEHITKISAQRYFQSDKQTNLVATQHPLKRLLAQTL
jgi:hypothetical protein